MKKREEKINPPPGFLDWKRPFGLEKTVWTFDDLIEFSVSPSGDQASGIATFPMVFRCHLGAIRVHTPQPAGEDLE